MKNIKVFGVAVFAIIAMLYIGADGMQQQLSFGPFFIFVGTCTAIGLVIDITNHIKLRIKKSNVRKLQP